MAVKYSKQRDFGAKGRKTRKLGKQMWTLKSMSLLKSVSKKKAQAWRKKGYKARVLPEMKQIAVRGGTGSKRGTKYYAVYTHTK